MGRSSPPIIILELPNFLPVIHKKKRPTLEIFALGLIAKKPK